MTRLVMGAVLAAAAFALWGCDDDCDELRGEARELIAKAQACGAGDRCLLVDMYEVAGANNCLGPFQCARAINVSTDPDAFRQEARRIVDAYRGCDPCVIADCFGPSTARCDEATAMCVAEEIAP